MQMGFSARGNLPLVMSRKELLTLASRCDALDKAPGDRGSNQKLTPKPRVEYVERVSLEDPKPRVEYVEKVSLVDRGIVEEDSRIQRYFNLAKQAEEDGKEENHSGQVWRDYLDHTGCMVHRIATGRKAGSRAIQSYRERNKQLKVPYLRQKELKRYRTIGTMLCEEGKRGQESMFVLSSTLEKRGAPAEIDLVVSFRTNIAARSYV